MNCYIVISMNCYCCEFIPNLGPLAVNIIKREYFETSAINIINIQALINIINNSNIPLPKPNIPLALGCRSTLEKTVKITT